MPPKNNTENNRFEMAVPRNILSVEVEDRLQEGYSDHDNKDRRSRILPVILHLLDLLDEQKTKVTFFILGYVAERFPEIVALIDTRGHEVASHSYHHIDIVKLSSDKLTDELKNSKVRLEDIIQKPVPGFKAPVSISRNTMPSIIQIAAQTGYKYFVGPEIVTKTSKPNTPVPMKITEGSEITVVPLSVLKRWGLTAHFSERLRIYPSWFIHRAIASLNKGGYPAIINLKLWEFDHNQLRPRGSDYTDYARYGNLDLTEQKLIKLLDIFEFTTFEERLGMVSQPEFDSDSFANTDSI